MQRDTCKHCERTVFIKDESFETVPNGELEGVYDQGPKVVCKPRAVTGECYPALKEEDKPTPH